MHRDVSHSNVMYRTLQDGQVIGVLNDFDFALDMDKKVEVPSSMRCIGTTPFMAIHLLSDEPPLHLYRHDLESLFWVMIWHVHRYDNDEFRGEQALFEDWTHVSSSDLALKKRGHLSMKVTAAETYQALNPLLNIIRLVFCFGFAEESLDIPDFDHSTLGGRVTFQVFEDLFQKHRPTT